ncbi:MAG: primosomal protein N', partial [Nostocales cyanobacterium]
MYIQDVKLSSLVVAEPQGIYQSNTKINQWVEVLVDYPGGTDLYTYKLPEQLEIKPGDILTVPFGTQQLGAIAIRLLSQPPADLAPEKIREVEDVVSRSFFPSNYWQLLNKISAYYYTPLIQVIKVALPPGLLGRSQRRLRLTSLGKNQDVANNTVIFMSPTAQQVLQILQKNATGDYSYYYIQQKIKSAYRGTRELIRLGLAENYLEPPKINQPKLQKAVTLIVDELPEVDDYDLTPRQQVRQQEIRERHKEIIEVLKRQGGELWQSELLQTCNTSTSVLKALEKKGCIVIEEREKLRREQGPTIAGDQPKSLTTAQTNALETIKSSNQFTQVLLHGVTGSGKTEVYLQAIAPLLNQGKSALVLVPEIGLTPQLTDRFRARFGNKVQVYHSALSDGERFDTWRQMFTGEPQVVIGTRSAIFSPLPNLGLIILDEEHDSSFKQDAPIPTYHARTVAQWRAELENCPLILGSATPSLESWVAVQAENTSPPPHLPITPPPHHPTSPSP